MAKAKKINNKERMERKANIVTTCIACVVLLCVLITGIVVAVTRAQNKANEQLSWQSAFARYAGSNEKDALEILSADYEVGVDEKLGYGPIVSVINGTKAADGFEWGVWVNDERITDRPADQIETKNGDRIVWQIVEIADQTEN